MYPLPFTNEVLDEVVGHKVYSFLDGFFNYHQIMISLKDRYKITFIIDWGTFTIQTQECSTNLSTNNEYDL
jgi:hypothetical protein